MKKLLILVLAIGLAGALAITRPTQDDFRKFAAQNIKVMDPGSSGSGTFGKLADELKTVAAGAANQTAADAYVNGCQFENDVLWTTVRRDGKTVYIGAVGRWVARGDQKSSGT